MPVATLPLSHRNTNLEGQLILPDRSTEARPAVMVMHDAMGLDSFEVERARQLADLGYVAVATDMYGEGAHFQSREDVGEHFLQFHKEPALIRERTLAWFEHLSTLPQVDATRIAAIGFCFGGQCVLELARSGADVRAVVSYHGLLSSHAPAAANSLDTSVAVYTGARDPYAPADQVDALRREMTAAGVDLQLTEFAHGYHAFTNPHPPGGVDDGMQYNKRYDAVSWAGTLALLNDVFA